MKYIIPFILLFSCKSSPEIKPPVLSPVNIDTSIIEKISSVQASQNRFYYILSLVTKRDSFLMKKYENEVLYYQTQNDKYRRRANRLVDSTNKYVHLIDSIAHQLNKK